MNLLSRFSALLRRASFCLRICASVVVFTSAALAQTDVTWNFGTVAPGQATPTTALPSDVTGGLVSQGNNNGTTTMLTSASVSSGYTGASGSFNAGAAARIGSLNTAAGGSAYFEVTFTPAPGKRLTISDIDFGTRSTGTGPLAFALFSSIDSFGASFASGTIANNNAWALKNSSFSAFTGATSAAVTVRIYGSGGSGGAQAGVANWRIDDLKITMATLPGVAAAPTVVSTSPANAASGVLLNAPITIAFDQPVNVAGSWFSIVGSLSGAHGATVSGGPTSFTLTPSAGFQESETITVTVLGAQVTEQVGGTLAMAGDHVFAFSTLAPPPLKFVHEVQGSGAASPIAGQAVTLDAVVTGFVTGGNGARDGFYVQEEDADIDNDEATSEGVYVFAPGSGVAATLAIGDRVTLTGTVTEFSGLTEITTLTNLAKLGVAPLPNAVAISLPAASATAFEPYEGMRVTFAQTLTVSGNNDLGHFGELVLSANGRLLQPTNVIDPNDNPAAGTSSSGATNVGSVTALQNANNLRSLVLDDASTRSYPDPTPHLNGAGATATRRVGDTVTGLGGILGYRFNFYRIDPQSAVTFVDANPRPVAPPAVGAANVRVASANVLNYFLTLGGAARGADTAAELARQRAKILAELSALNADVFGLMEIERRADNAAIADLVTGLNDLLGAGTYAFVNSFPIAGTDAIQVALIYKPSVVAPVGNPVTDTSPGAAIHNRPPLAQTFSLTANGEKFTVVVNHLKSKSGSGTGADADLGDGQAEFNATRKQQAAQLLTFLANPTATFGDPDVLIIGDLNSYAEEDPIDILRAGGFANQLERFHPAGTYSYNFANQSGYLDHALASASLVPQVVGAAEWHVNADEPSFYDYNAENKTTAHLLINTGTPYRASDHDPVVIGLKLLPPAPPSGYATWIAHFGLPAGQDDPAFDFDGDRSSNFFEYATGSRPDDPSETGAPSVANEAGFLTFRFNRRVGLPDVTYSVLVSTDLVAWSDWPEPLSIEALNGDRETLVARIPQAPRRFVKLAVTRL